MKTHDLIQGSPEWLAYRARHFNASDAPAMMGVSIYKTRADLLRETHTGVPAAVDAGTQKRYDNGHRLEALARPLAEEFIGAELYPVTGSEGRLSASFDGLTLDETMAFEHKALNAELRAAIRQDDGNANDFLPPMYRVQMEQQLMVSGAERVLFMASNWDAEGNLVEERHCWYRSDPLLRQQIADGWAQFERDLAAYVLPTSAPTAATGKAPETLPALRIEVTGMVTASNLAEFKDTALAAIRSVNRSLSTDADFADAEKAVKWCGDVESRLSAAKEHALSQTASIDALFKAIDDISAEARRVRLDLDRLVTRRKVEVKDEAVSKARAALDAHIAALNAEIAPMRLQPVAADFAGAIKGKRSIDSMQDALDTTLATAKIATDAGARAIRINVATFKERAAGFEFLFADLGQVVHKPADDFGMLVTARIDAHKAEQERKRIENEKAEHLRNLMSELQGINQQVQIAQIGRLGVRKGGTIECLRETLAETEAWQLEPAHWGEHLQRAQEAKAGAITAIRNLLANAEQAAPAVASAAPPPQQPAPAPRIAAPAARNEPATLKLGTMADRLGFRLSREFVADTLGFEPAIGSAMLWCESEWPRICAALIAHVGRVQELQAA